MIFRRRKKSKRNPYETRTKTLHSSRVTENPVQEIKSAIWALINSNCFPPRSSSFSDASDSTPVTDVTVQTFYVVYSNRTELIETLGRLNGESIARQIISEMIGFGSVYEPYLIDKIGEAQWQTAKENDEKQRSPGRVDAAWNTRIIDVFLIAGLKESTFEIRVVGRESLAVERSRLQNRTGKDPNVLAGISVGNSAFSNPHLSEYIRTNEVARSQSRPIYILEGRNAREFVVGSNIYDDIRVPGMPDDEWYVLRINSSEAHRNVIPQLKDWAGNDVLSSSPTGTKWCLNGKGNNGNSDWFCDITFTPFPPMPISRFPDAHEVPPSIQITGRVLPLSTARRRYMPEAVERHITGTTLNSGIILEPDLYLYSTDDNSRFYLLNLDQKKAISVETASGGSVNLTEKGFELEDDVIVTVGKMKYRWESRNRNGSTLPRELGGVLFDIGDRPLEVLPTPISRDDPGEWFIGNWKNGIDGALSLGKTPIFVQNPDLYLAHAGNLLLKHADRDSQGRPILNLSLKKVENELLFIVRTDRSWRTIEWPEFGNEMFFDVPNVMFVGEGLALIFGTNYYGIKTSGTLKS